MHKPEHKPPATPNARTRTVLAFLLLSTMAALLSACGGENPSSLEGEAATPGPAGAGSTTLDHTDGGSGSTSTGKRGVGVASGSAERFGMGPEEARVQGAPDPPRTEPAAGETDRPPDAQGPASPRAQEAPVSPAPPEPAGPSRSIAPEPAPTQPDDLVPPDPGDVSPPSTPAPAPEKSGEVSVAQADPLKNAPRPENPAAADPAESPPPAAQAPGSDKEAAAPSDTEMYLTVPALGIEDAPVVSDSSKEAMDQGVIHVPGTQFPWLPSGEEGSNTYLAAHRIGYPGTGSDRVFHDLPALALGDEVTLTDSNGTAYEYRVSEAAEVSPYDTWVANPIPGRDVVTLQTCIEDFGDPWTEGPDWAARYVVRADRAS